MRNARIEFVEFDDVYEAVRLLLERGADIDSISLREIREVMGDRGSLSTISKHFQPIKARVKNGRPFEANEVSDADTKALLTIVGDIVMRCTAQARREKAESDAAMSDMAVAHQADLSLKDELLDDLEHHVCALEGENGAQKLVIDSLETQVTRLTGGIEALQAAFDALAPTASSSVPHVDDGNAQAEQAPAVDADRPSDRQAEMPFAPSDDQAEDLSDAGHLDED